MLKNRIDPKWAHPYTADTDDYVMQYGFMGQMQALNDISDEEVINPHTVFS